MPSWTLYLEAAIRKVAIAAYHADRLAEVLAADHPGKDRLPSVAVQAHFEGVVIAIMAAVDQVALAIKKALKLDLRTNELVGGAFPAVARPLPEVQAWFEDPLGRDLRKIRVRIIHYSYSKTPHARTRDGLAWEVESADTQYSGSRELLDYARAAVSYGGQLQALLPTLRVHLSKPKTTT